MTPQPPAHGPNGDGPAAPQPQAVMPRPADYSVTVEAMQTPTGPWVCMQVATHLGMAFYFFRPDQARGIAALLNDAAGNAATGLYLPPGAGGGGT